MLSLPVNSIPMIVAVGGVLGGRHAFEPDHLAAVSTLATRPAARFWSAAELLVAAVLVLLGGVVIWRYARGRWHMHTHSHVAASPHFHLHSHASSPDHGHSHTGGDARRSLGFGIAHGLAGSGAIAALLVAAAPDAATRIAYFAAFGAGTIVGMLGVSLTLSVLVRFAAERGARWATVLHVGAAVGSVVAGVAVGWSVLSS